MRHALKNVIGVVMLNMFLTSCYRLSEYSGDGQLIDNGILAATDRYVLRLTEIDLSSVGSYQYKISNLPKENFGVGIRIEFDELVGQSEFSAEQVVDPVILLELSMEGANPPIFRKTASLRDWTWSIPSIGCEVFVYGRDDEPTFFTPTKETSYLMTLTILRPDSSGLQYAANLEAKSGGWK